ncbi:MAG: TIGR03905 family TSCPD domain-containing protein [Clostridiales bacterium]|jgi:uncharacterized protein (TIGR03905 family)|nr:TIGR03905 family TSCPD domain-containing protein [Clostridiales bacterium]
MESYRTSGTCSKQIIFKVHDNKLADCRFVGGCSGNLQAVSRLCIGRDIDELIAGFKDIKCRNGTSCPAQLALALREYKTAKEAPADGESER